MCRCRAFPSWVCDSSFVSWPLLPSNAGAGKRGWLSLCSSEKTAWFDSMLRTWLWDITGANYWPHWPATTMKTFDVQIIYGSQNWGFPSKPWVSILSHGPMTWIWGYPHLGPSTPPNLGWIAMSGRSCGASGKGSCRTCVDRLACCCSLKAEFPANSILKTLYIPCIYLYIPYIYIIIIYLTHIYI